MVNRIVPQLQVLTPQEDKKNVPVSAPAHKVSATRKSPAGSGQPSSVTGGTKALLPLALRQALEATSEPADPMRGHPPD